VGEPGPCYLFKVVLIGDSGAGKTSLLNYFMDKTFQANSKSTIGADFVKKTDVPLHGVEDRDTCDLQIWDTAGEERFSAVTPIFFRGAKAIIVVYDCKTEVFYKRRVSAWFDEAYNMLGEDKPPFFLIANKSDLLGPDDPDPQEEEEIQKVLQSVPAPTFRLVSCKDGTGLDGLIEDIAEKCNIYTNCFKPPPNIKRAH